MGRVSEQPRLVGCAIWMATIVVAVSLIGGLAAALVGGPLTDLGSGAGGLYGFPSLLLNVAALPCVNGWWGPESRIGSQPLCERFGSELNWHTRFHLLAHAVPAAVLVAIYGWAIRRWVGVASRPDVM